MLKVGGDVIVNWTKITDELQVCKVEKDSKTYTFALKLQDIGVNGSGKALVLWGKLLDTNSEVLGCFWTKSDGYSTYHKSSHSSKLWTPKDAEDEALVIIGNIVENVY